MMIIPVMIAFGIVAVLHLLVNFGVGVPGFLMEPVVQVWILFAGTVITFCLWMRQIFLMLGVLGLSLVLLVAYYGLYMVG